MTHVSNDKVQVYVLPERRMLTSCLLYVRMDVPLAAMSWEEEGWMEALSRHGRRMDRKAPVST